MEDTMKFVEIYQSHSSSISTLLQDSAPILKEFANSTLEIVDFAETFTANEETQATECKNLADKKEIDSDFLEISPNAVDRSAYVMMASKKAEMMGNKKSD
eukprot:Awhi_evm1s15243